MHGLWACSIVLSIEWASWWWWNGGERGARNGGVGCRCFDADGPSRGCERLTRSASARSASELAASYPLRRRNTTSPATQGHDHSHTVIYSTGEHGTCETDWSVVSGQRSEVRGQRSRSVAFSHFRCQPLNPSTPPTLTSTFKPLTMPPYSYVHQ